MDKKSLIKEKTILEAQKYELDKKQIMKFYGLKEKLYTKYNVIQKKVVNSKECSIAKIDKNLRLSNFQTFRMLLLQQFNLEEMKEEFENANELCSYSKKLREDLSRFFKIPIDETSVYSLSKKDGYYFKKKRANDNDNNITLVDDFLKKCRLLKLKTYEEKDPIKSTFRLYSDLDKPSDPYSVHSLRQEQLNKKFYNKKKKLMQVYNREFHFVNYIWKIRDGLIKVTPDSLHLTTKDNFSSESVEALFDLRNELYFNKIDSFALQYDLGPYKVKNEEKDLYEKIYSILSKNNYMGFLSYLYSNNHLFQYIYDEFSDKDTMIDPFDLEEMVSNNVHDTKSPIELRLIHHKDSSNNSENNELSLMASFERGSALIYDKIAGCYAFIPIGIIDKEIKEEIIYEFFSHKKRSSNDYENLEFFTLIEKCSELNFDYALLISKDGQLQIFSNNSDNESNSDSTDLFYDENIDNINFYQVFKSDLQQKINHQKISKLFLYQDKEIPLQTNSYSFYLFQNTLTNLFYLFKIKRNYSDNFERNLTKYFEKKKMDIKDLIMIFTLKEKTKLKKHKISEVVNEDVKENGNFMQIKDVQSSKDSYKENFKNEEEEKQEENESYRIPERNIKEKFTIKNEEKMFNGNNIHREKEKTSILNSSSHSDTSKESGIKNIMKRDNEKKFTVKSLI